MNILIVDDDYVSRTKMKTILQTLGSCRDEEKATDALKTFEETLETDEAFHLVTLDIHMPDMDGIEVLYRLRQIEEMKKNPDSDRAKIVMVTSQADKGSLITCLQAGCDGFVVKPFSRKTLFEKLHTAGIPVHGKKQPGAPEQATVPAHDQGTSSARGDLITEVSQALKNDLLSLPSLPDINTQLKEMVQKQIKASEITGLLKKDMFIATSLISLSNSALFKGVQKNKTLEEAINRLGIDQTFHHVEMLCQRALYSGVGIKYTNYVENLWKHAQECAYACQHVAEQLSLTLSEDPFTLGLVHDIGRLILLQIISKLEEVGPTGEDVDEDVLYPALDTYHGEFGAALLKKWNFSNTFALVASHHHHPGSVPKPPMELILVCFVDLLVKNLDKKTDKLLANPAAAFCADKLKLNGNKITDIRASVMLVLEEMVQ